MEENQPNTRRRAASTPPPPRRVDIEYPTGRSQLSTLLAMAGYAAVIAAFFVLLHNYNTQKQEHTENVSIARRSVSAHLHLGNRLYEAGSFDAALAEDRIAYEMADKKDNVS